jgi:hypothetical protein
MKKYISLIIFTIIVYNNKLYSQINFCNNIEYRFSEEVKLILINELKLNPRLYDTLLYTPALLLEFEYDTVICYLVSGRKKPGSGFKLDSLVLLTNRYLNLNGKKLLPIIFDWDLRFSKFSHSLTGRFFYVSFNKRTGKVYKKGW